MTSEQQLNIVMTMIDEQEDDEVLSTYLSIAAEKIICKAYPFGTKKREVPDEYKILQCEIAAYLINKRGADYQVAHDENGIKRTYGSMDVPDQLMSVIVPRCGVI